MRGSLRGHASSRSRRAPGGTANDGDAPTSPGTRLPAVANPCCMPAHRRIRGRLEMAIIAAFRTVPGPMNPDRFPATLPDTFALHEGALIALQVNAARALGRSDTHFRDTLRDGTARPSWSSSRRRLRIRCTAAGSGAGAGPSAPRRADRAQLRHRRVSGHHGEFEVYARAPAATARELVWLSGREPAINVRQTEARDYCVWLSEQTGRAIACRLNWNGSTPAAPARPALIRRVTAFTPADALYNASQGYDAGAPQAARACCRAASCAAAPWRSANCAPTAGPARHAGQRLGISPPARGPATMQPARGAAAGQVRPPWSPRAARGSTARRTVRAAARRRRLETESRSQPRLSGGARGLSGRGNPAQVANGRKND